MHIHCVQTDPAKHVNCFGTKPGHHAVTSFTKLGPAILTWPIYFAPCLLISMIKSTKWWFLSSLFINHSFNTFRSIQCEQFKEKLSEIRGWGQADRHFAAHYRLCTTNSGYYNNGGTCTISKYFSTFIKIITFPPLPVIYMVVEHRVCYC
jgi:hypothetical protein